MGEEWLRDCQSHGRWILPHESLMSAQAESLKVVYCHHSDPQPLLMPALLIGEKAKTSIWKTLSTAILTVWD